MKTHKSDLKGKQKFPGGLNKPMTINIQLKTVLKYMYKTVLKYMYMYKKLHIQAILGV